MNGTGSRKPVRKQQQRSLRTQEKLLTAAAEAFAENGFKGTSTRDIAARAGVHHPLITYHFKSKDVLWRAAVSRVFDRFVRMLVEKREQLADASPRQRATVLMRQYVHFAAQNPEMHKILFQEASHANPRIDWLIDTYLRPLYDAGVKDLIVLQDQGIAPPGSPAILYNLIRLSTASLLALRFEVRGTSGLDFDRTETIDELAEMMIRIYLSADETASTS